MKIVLDLGAIAHRLRRWWFGHFGGFYRNLNARCVDCGTYLNADEREHYGFTCEACEGMFSASMDAARVDAVFAANRRRAGL